jgi:hypothetical protein
MSVNRGCSLARRSLAKEGVATILSIAFVVGATAQYLTLTFAAFSKSSLAVSAVHGNKPILAEYGVVVYLFLTERSSHNIDSCHEGAAPLIVSNLYPLELEAGRDVLSFSVADLVALGFSMVSYRFAKDMRPLISF